MPSAPRGFLVPGALGIQEGGYMMLAALVGIPAHLGLTLSLARRVREMMLSVPALLAWQVSRGDACGRRLAEPEPRPLDNRGA